MFTSTYKCVSMMHSNRTLFVGFILAVVVYVISVSVFHVTREATKREFLRPCPCRPNGTSLAVGHTQLRQYRRWRKLTSSKNYTKITRNLSQYIYKIHVIEPNIRCDVISVRLYELYNSTMTAGGSCFRVMSESFSQREMCSYVDHFNGTYDVWCPGPPPGCAVVTIQLQYVDFEAYSETIVPFNRTLLRREICPWNIGQQYQTPRHPNSPATWVRDGANWTPLQPVQRSMIHNEKAMCDCIENTIDKLVMIGASHMRYKFDYLFATCFGESALKHRSRKHGSTSFGKRLHFISATNSYDFEPLWNDSLKGLNLTNRSVILFQTGSHDLGKPGQGHVLVLAMAPRLNVYVNTLFDIKRRADTLGFKMVVMTSPPYPDEGYLNRVSRNNHNLAALSRSLHEKMSTHSISVFDEFATLVVQQDHFPPDCGIHYICRIPGQGIRGNVGIIAFQMLMAELCITSKSN